MKIISSQSLNYLKRQEKNSHKILLFGRTNNESVHTCGAAIKERILEIGVNPHPLAWDFMSIALTVMSADLLVKRSESSDGWTREIALSVSVSNPDFWENQKSILFEMLKFLTTDIWHIDFFQDEKKIVDNSTKLLSSDCVTLLSGGMDSLIGLIDLCKLGRSPAVVSQIVTGDKSKQKEFVNLINEELNHFQFNHNISCNGESSTRSRSIIFFAYGILIGSCLENFYKDIGIDFFVCENGLISINVPLTTMRLGSLSTRTTNPIYMNYLQALLNAMQFNLRIINPYQFKTKGEMSIECKDQALLKSIAKKATSCGRFGRYGFKQCGRCVPCLIRRAAFKKWGHRDYSKYFFNNLAKKDSYNANFDDVRSAAVALTLIEMNGYRTWLGPTLSNEIFLKDRDKYAGVIQRGMEELKVLLKHYKIL